MIVSVRIYLDDDMPDYLLQSSRLRCGQVISLDQQENETDHQELIDNKEFQSERALIKHVAQKLGVIENIVEIVD